MKQIIIIIIALCFLSAKSQAQCYLKYTDISGFSLSNDELKILSDSACALRNILPAAIRDSFVVVDFGFNNHNPDVSGFFSEFIALMEKQLATNPKTKYYLLFARESSSEQGLNANIWVKVVLPMWGQFS